MRLYRLYTLANQIKGLAAICLANALDCYSHIKPVIRPIGGRAARSHFAFDSRGATPQVATITRHRSIQDNNAAPLVGHCGGNKLSNTWAFGIPEVHKFIQKGRCSQIGYVPPPHPRVQS